MSTVTKLSGEGSTASADVSDKWENTVKEELILQAAAMPAKEVPSCMTLFDTWASCFALGPQFKHIYRYGYPNDCKPKLEDFKYCLTLKGKSEEERRAIWIRRRAEAAATKRLSQSSEDVWSMRRTPLLDPSYALDEVSSPS